MSAAQPDASAELLDRAAMTARLARETFDLAIIGGGINGAAVARDATLRGLRVALVDRSDFASGTSSRSSKLVHGGLRYLPQGQLTLVYRALRERERLRHLTAPHLVRPIQFLMPFYRGRKPGRLAMRTGLALYDLMAMTRRAERHHALSAAATLALEPQLSSSKLLGGATYYDGWGDDARLTLENVLDAAYHGAAIVNYVAVTGFVRAGSNLAAIAALDLESGTTFEIRARRIVNAAGPWADGVRAMDNPTVAPILRLTKGVHLVVSRERLPLRLALVLTDQDGRIIFLIPEGGYVLVGTTDTDFAGDPVQVTVDSTDIDYLLAIVNGALPDVNLQAADMVAGFAGLRALSKVTSGASASQIPRDELIEESASGLLTVAGGKLTTHRVIAELVVNRLAAALDRTHAKSPTLTLPLPGARPHKNGAQALSEMPATIKVALRNRYGSRTEAIAAIATEHPTLLHPLVPGGQTIAAEVIFAVRHEMARTVADFLVRRTALSWRAPHEASAAAPAVARLMATELGWTPERELKELRIFKTNRGTDCKDSVPTDDMARVPSLSLPVSRQRTE